MTFLLEDKQHCEGQNKICSVFENINDENEDNERGTGSKVKGLPQIMDPLL